MMRLEAGSRLVVASHNEGKVREINDLIRPFGVAAVSARELNLPEPAETGETFAENAVLKAVAATTASGLAALSAHGHLLFVVKGDCKPHAALSPPAGGSGGVPTGGRRVRERVCPVSEKCRAELRPCCRRRRRAPKRTGWTWE